MQTREEVLEKVFNPIMSTENHYEIAEDYRQQIKQYERIVFTAPLIGNGTGFVVLSTSILASQSSDLFAQFYIWSLWGYFVGMIAIFFAGIFYIWNMSEWSDESNSFGRCQNTLSVIRRIANENKVDKTTAVSSILSSSVEEQIKKVLLEYKVAKLHSRKGSLFLKVSRIFIVISAILFFIATAIPLIGFSITLGSMS